MPRNDENSSFFLNIFFVERFTIKENERAKRQGNIVRERADEISGTVFIVLIIMPERFIVS